MSELSTFASQYKLVDPQGNIQYIGVGQILNPVSFTNNEASNKIFASEVIQFDTANMTFPRFDRVAAGGTIPSDLPQAASWKALKATTTAVVCIGVSVMDTAITLPGVAGGAGTLCTTTCITAASLTSNAAGAQVTPVGGTNGSGTAAFQVQSVAAGTALGNGTRIGFTLRPAGTTVASQTGSLTQLGILVMPD